LLQFFRFDFDRCNASGGELKIKTKNVVLTTDQKHMIAVGGLDDFVALTVTDTGTGISQGMLDQVFDPFYTTKDIGKGNGLGLCMVHEFAKQSGGFAQIESEIGARTTVSIFLVKSNHAATTKER